MYCADVLDMSWADVIEQIKDWQALVAGVIGGGVLIWTVRWTLLSERRRREQEGRALRTALGAEVRHFAGRALDSLTQLFEMLEKLPPSLILGIPTRRIENLMHFPEPVVYQRTTASELGTLGERAAHEVVFFFGQVMLVRDAAKRLPSEEPAMSRSQLLHFAQGLLNALEAAAQALQAFVAAERADGDRKFAESVAAAHQSLEKEKARVPEGT